MIRVSTRMVADLWVRTGATRQGFYSPGVSLVGEQSIFKKVTVDLCLGELVASFVS